MKISYFLGFEFSIRYLVRFFLKGWFSVSIMGNIEGRFELGYSGLVMIGRVFVFSLVNFR